MEWVPAEALGVTDDQSRRIHPVMCKHLEGNSMAQFFQNKAQQCSSCCHSVVSEECTRLCTKVRWTGVTPSARTLQSRLVQGDKFKTSELWETKLSKLVMFDL